MVTAEGSVNEGHTGGGEPVERSETVHWSLVWATPVWK